MGLLCSNPSDPCSCSSGALGRLGFTLSSSSNPSAHELIRSYTLNSGTADYTPPPHKIYVLAAAPATIPISTYEIWQNAGTIYATNVTITYSLGVYGKGYLFNLQNTANQLGGANWNLFLGGFVSSVAYPGNYEWFSDASGLPILQSSDILQEDISFAAIYPFPPVGEVILSRNDAVQGPVLYSQLVPIKA